jgi:hypothetical protein
MLCVKIRRFFKPTRAALVLIVIIVLWLLAMFSIGVFYPKGGN